MAQAAADPARHQACDDGRVGARGRSGRRAPQLNQPEGTRSPTGPIAASISLQSETIDAGVDGWTLVRRRGDSTLLLDMPPQPGRDAEAERLFVALEAGDLQALARSDHRFAGYFLTPDRLILFRDPLGTRPLHYRHRDEGWQIATMPQDLLQEDDALDWRWLARRAAMRMRSSDGTAWRSIHRVLPGQSVTIERASGKRSVQHYWRPETRPTDRPFEEVVAQARSLVEQSCMRALSDAEHPVALQLTGGLDSSLLALCVQDADQPVIALTGKPATSLAIAPPGFFLDDAERAAATALRLELDHQVAVAASTHLLEDISRWNHALGEPAANGDNLAWLDALYRAATKRGAERILSGGSGNFTTSWPGSGALAEARRRGPGSWLHALRAHRRHTGASWSGMLLLSFPRLHQWWQRKEVSGNPFVSGSDGEWRVPRERRAVREEIIFGHDPGPWNEAVRRLHGLDEIDIFADRRLVELCLTLPEWIYADGGQPRALGRALLRGRLPDALVDETARGLQGADWAGRIAGEREALLGLATEPGDCGPIDRAALVAALQSFDPATAGADETVSRFDLLRTVAALQFVRWAR